MGVLCLVCRGRVGSFALVGCGVAALLPTLALAASAGPSHGSAVPPASKTIAWDGQATITARNIVAKGSFPLTYRVQFSWHATWNYDAASKTFRPSSTAGAVTGTASRTLTGGSATDCSGPVTGVVGTPAVSIDGSGNVVFDAAAIPGFTGGGADLSSCYGSVVPPIFPQMSRAKFAFHAKAKLSSLLAGTASASDTNSDHNTSTFQGSVCTKGCVAQTPANTGGYRPIGPAKTTPKPSDPIYTYQGSVSWSAKVSAVATGSCSAPADVTLLAQAKENARQIAFKAVIDDSNAQILKLIRYGRTVRARYPSDQAMRKTLMNAELSKVDEEIRAIYAAAKRQLASDAARDVARAKCPDTKQLIQGTYDSKLTHLTSQEDTDLRFAASRAVKVIKLNCGCVG